MTAYEFLRDNGWCQGAYARDAFGMGVNLQSQQARSFCAMGALIAAYNDKKMVHSDAVLLAEQNVYNVLERRGYCGAISSFNDDNGRTKDEVLELFKEAGV